MIVAVINSAQKLYADENFGDKHDYSVVNTAQSTIDMARRTR